LENLTVVIPFWNGHATIGRLLDSLPADLLVIVVDDLSDDPLHLDKANVQVIRLDVRGYFSGAVNAGIQACKTDVLVLNQDAWLEGTAWMEQLAEVRSVAIAGDSAKHPAWPAGYVQGTFMYVNRQAWDEVGPLNAKEFPLWGSTCEWQLRACRAGYDFHTFEVAGFHHDRATERTHGYQLGTAITETMKREPGRAWEFLHTPPTVSVIVPCYNYGKYLEDCISSLLGGLTCLGEMEPQTFQSFEVVIVDDASTDDTWEVIQALADRKKGIRGLHLNQNRGTPAVLNIGVERSFGEYIQVLSADDMLESWTLERHYQACRENPHHFAYGGLTIVKNGVRERPFPLPPYDFEKVIQRNLVSAGIMYPRQAWKDVGGYPEIMREGREDWAFNVGLGIKGWCGVHVGDNGYLYRRERQNRSWRTGNQHAGEPPSPEVVRWRNLFKDQMRELYPEIYVRGERPMGCCGGGRSKKATPKATPRAVSVARDLPGRAGMTRLEYIGRNQGDTTWWGPETETRYVFGGNRRVGYVDSKDVAGMLAMKKEDKPVFRVFRPPAKPKAPPVVKEIKAPEVPDIQNLTGAAIKALTITADQVPVLLKQEQAGKARKTIIAYLEGLSA